jgi:hypothetical protein
MKFNVFGLDGYSLGDFTAIASPTWTLGGNAAVTPGGSITVSIPESVAVKPWVQLGNLVATRPHPDLELWAGIIDTPWEATLPVQMTLYNIEYLLNIRMPDSEALTTGSAEVILRKMIEVANAQQELFLRMGQVNNINAVDRQETIKQVNLWDQFQNFAKRTATEFITRPVIEGGRLMIYLDLASSIGEDTNYLLYDGDGGNMTINKATVEGEIWNRVIGVGSQSTAASRLQSPAQVDATSVSKQRLRSLVQQFDVKTDAALLENTKAHLAAYKNPYIKLDVKILNHKHVFRLLRRGNSFVTQASKLYLPGGIKAWKGLTRLTTMTYLESERAISMKLTGGYNG